MRVPNSSSDAVATMEIARTGNYGNDMSEEKLFHECAGCDACGRRETKKEIKISETPVFMECRGIFFVFC